MEQKNGKILGALLLAAGLFFTACGNGDAPPETGAATGTSDTISTQKPDEMTRDQVGTRLGCGCKCKSTINGTSFDVVLEMPANGCGSADGSSCDEGKGKLTGCGQTTISGAIKDAVEQVRAEELPLGTE